MNLTKIIEALTGSDAIRVYASLEVDLLAWSSKVKASVDWSDCIECVCVDVWCLILLRVKVYHRTGSWTYLKNVLQTNLKLSYNL